MRKIKVRGSLLAEPSAVTVLANKIQIYRGFVGIRFPLFTEIDLCVCDIDVDPREDNILDLEMKVDLGVVKFGIIRPNLGNVKMIKPGLFDKTIDTTDSKFYGAASDFRQQIWINGVEQQIKPGWAYEVNAQQTFKTSLFLPKELQYDIRYKKD